jgi:hypothetical protein
MQSVLSSSSSPGQSRLLTEQGDFSHGRQEEFFLADAETLLDSLWIPAEEIRKVIGDLPDDTPGFRCRIVMMGSMKFERGLVGSLQTSITHRTSRTVLRAFSEET